MSERGRVRVRVRECNARRGMQGTGMVCMGHGPYLRVTHFEYRPSWGLDLKSDAKELASQSVEAPPLALRGTVVQTYRCVPVGSELSKGESGGRIIVAVAEALHQCPRQLAQDRIGGSLRRSRGEREGSGSVLHQLEGALDQAIWSRRRRGFSIHSKKRTRCSFPSSRAKRSSEPTEADIQKGFCISRRWS